MELSVDITNFTAGELSPSMKGRFDFAKYYNGCDTALNMVMMPQGGATKRPGTLFVAANKDQANKPRLKDFIFSNQQPYVLQFSNLNVRIHKNDGTVLNAGNPVDVTVPYTTADLPALKFAQSADTLFIAHPNYPPASLTRTSDIAWTYTVLTFSDGPYLNSNLTTNAVTPSGKTGSITLTWDSTVGINNGNGFTSQDIGRFVRVKLLSLWACCLITAVGSTTSVTATVQAKTNNGNAGAIDGASWAGNTLYAKGEVVKGPDGVSYYIAVAAGKSQTGGNGPYGQGTQILDGTVIWSAVTGLAAQPYQNSTFYNLGDIVYTQLGSLNYYQAETPGKSYSGNNGPTGTGHSIVDASILWDYVPPFTMPTKTVNWALGAYCPQNGYPYTVRFWQQRLLWGGFPAVPNQIFGSSTGDFLNHAPTKSDGTVLDTNALSWIIDDDKVQAIQWLIGAGSAQAQQLGMGTAAGEQILQGASAAQALTPTSVQAYGETAYGSASNVDPLRIGKAVLFADRTGRKLREWAFYWQMNGYNGPDLLQFSDHITKASDGSNPALNGIAQMVYQQAPYQVIWAIRNDGQLLSFTYDRDQTVFAPARHQLGGTYYGGAPLVESIAVIPSQDNTYDEVWLSVVRTNAAGSVFRQIEVLTRYFDGQPVDQAYFVDGGLPSALTYPAASISLSGFTNSASDATMPATYTGTGTITATAGTPFASTDVANKKILRVNGGKILITGYTSTTVVTGQVISPMLNMAPAVTNGWSYNSQVTSFSGLSSWNGETFAILGDGAAMGTATISGGTIALPNNQAASYAAVGYPYVPLLVSMPFEPVRAAAAASSGKVKRVGNMWVRFKETLGASFGRRLKDPMTDFIENKMEPVVDRGASDPMDSAPVLYSGIRALNPQGGFDQEGQVLITQTDPLPLTVLSIVANANVEEMPSAA